MVYAQIKDGIVQNVIALNDEDLLSTFAVGFDYCIIIDQEQKPTPAIGWSYDGEAFNPPD